MLAALGRTLVVLGLAVGGYAAGGSWMSALAGVVSAAAVLGAEAVAAQAESRVLLSGAFGLLVGLLLAGLAGSALAPEPTAEGRLARLGLVVGFAWLGLAMDARHFEAFSLATLKKDLESKPEPEVRKTTPKLLDTSVIIAGRIAEIAEARF